MIKINKKNKLTNSIGKYKFLAGLFIGLGYAVTFNYLLRLVTIFSNIEDLFALTKSYDLLKIQLDYEFSNYYLYLISFTSISFGFCYTTYFWSGKPKLNTKRLTRLNRESYYNSLFVLYMPLLFLSRMVIFFTGIDITIKNDVGIIAFLFPIYIYIYCWNNINKSYKSLKELYLISLLVVILVIILTLI